eukprot:TRINITY_DN22212_c0_g1_i1.p1 TRINITY_DN22212_c0_g1~~TRINITY_DN22212_c0_g1_i1.p1  ORF type:complete len:617 (+),score=103.94 TRINITY_DN22212_c0_g1_i1:108-1958(+)
MAGGRGGLLFSVFFVLFMRVAAKFVVEKHSLTITSPSKLKGDYDSALANFGIPQYGFSMAGMIFYPEDGYQFGCQKFQDKNIDFKSKPGSLQSIVLLDRGECFFTQKVWNAQVAGASAVLVADDKDEELITMIDGDKGVDYLLNISIPSALIKKELSDQIKEAVKSKDLVTVSLDWRESLPHPDNRVEYEFWTNSNDECGPKCDMQVAFVKDFKGIAQTLEKGGYSQFTPHYITWYCPKEYITSDQCKSQCINNGRYCAPDPEKDFTTGYDGKDVVMENLRQLCVFKHLNDSKTPWVWWDYVTDFEVRCKMSEKNYNKECAEKVMVSLGVDVRSVEDCVGDQNSDVANALLKAEQEYQVGSGERGDVTILPTVVINQRQYRGKLDATSVMKAICSGFKESTEPPVCLGATVETNECLNNNGGCWHQGNYTACKDTFRGRICECPSIPEQGVYFAGDGYTECEPANGPGRCAVKNGGCWGSGQFSACQETGGCQCPPGFEGDGKDCTDIDECKAGKVCRCSTCKCTNTIGSFDCSCGGGLIYIQEHDACISKKDSGMSVWVLTVIILSCVAVVSLGGYVIYKYRLRSYMDSEIRAIMAQYMPLDSQTEGPHRLVDEP